MTVEADVAVLKNQVAELQGTLGTLIANLLEPALIGPYATFGDGGIIQLNNSGMQVKAGSSAMGAVHFTDAFFTGDPLTKDTYVALNGSGNASALSLALSIFKTAVGQALVNPSVSAGQADVSLSAFEASATMAAGVRSIATSGPIQRTRLWVTDDTTPTMRLDIRDDAGTDPRCDIVGGPLLLPTVAGDFVNFDEDGMVEYDTTSDTFKGRANSATVTFASTAYVDAHTGDTSDAHDASAISILDTAGDFTATDVEGALAELQADAEAHVAAADPHTGYLKEADIAAKGDLFAGTADNTVGILTVGTNGKSLKAASGEATGLQWAVDDVAITYVIDGGGSAITTGVKGYLEVPFAMTITGWTLVAKESGSIVIDVWKDTYANFPPDNSDSIAGAELPTLSSVQKNQDVSLSTWTTAVAAGDVIGFNVDSITTCTQVALTIRGTRP